METIEVFVQKFELNYFDMRFNMRRKTERKAKTTITMMNDEKLWVFELVLDSWLSLVPYSSLSPDLDIGLRPVFSSIIARLSGLFSTSWCRFWQSIEWYLSWGHLSDSSILICGANCLSLIWSANVCPHRLAMAVLKQSKASHMAQHSLSILSQNISFPLKPKEHFHFWDTLVPQSFKSGSVLLRHQSIWLSDTDRHILWWDTMIATIDSKPNITNWH